MSFFLHVIVSQYDDPTPHNLPAKHKPSDIGLSSLTMFANLSWLDFGKDFNILVLFYSESYVYVCEDI